MRSPRSTEGIWSIQFGPSRRARIVDFRCRLSRWCGEEVNLKMSQSSVVSPTSTSLCFKLVVFIPVISEVSDTQLTR